MTAVFRSTVAFLGRSIAWAVWALGLSAGVAACAPSGVGDPCTPENIPPGGFDEREAYVETGSVQCRTRVCLVYRYQGDPTRCEQEECADIELQDIADRVFCSCRCRAPEGQPTCACPEGFVCTEDYIINNAMVPGTQGAYCVKKSLYCNDNPDATPCK